MVLVTLFQQAEILKRLSDPQLLVYLSHFLQFLGSAYSSNKPQTRGWVKTNQPQTNSSICPFPKPRANQPWSR